MKRVFRQRCTWIQARRIACGGCGAPFVYLARGQASAEAEGVAWLSLLQSDQRLREGAQEALRDQLRAIEAKRRAGRARCPGCGRYQRWMWVPREAVRNVLYGLGLGLVVGPLALAALARAARDLPPGVSWSIFALVGPLGCAVLGYWIAVRGWVPAGLGDPAALTLEDFAALQAEARARQTQPELLWLERLQVTRDPLWLRAGRALNEGPATAPDTLEVLSARLAEDGGFL